jgi:hypothetical protein
MRVERKLKNWITQRINKKAGKDEEKEAESALTHKG